MSNETTYLVQITMYLGRYEKTSLHMVTLAGGPQMAGKIALTDECHNDPEFLTQDDGKEFRACMDGDLEYEIEHIKPLTDEEAAQYRNITWMRSTNNARHNNS